MGDSVHALAHDHREINRQVFAVAAALRSVENDASAFPTVASALAALHDLLFAHFAREEEGLFPFLTETFRDLADSVNEMIVAHDRICGALTRALHLSSSADNIVAIRTMYERFETVYARHASTESALLGELDARLDQAQRTALARLIDDL